MSTKCDPDWFHDGTTQRILKEYLALRDSHLKELLANAARSTDPDVLRHAVAIQTIDRLMPQKSKPEGNEDEE